MRRSAAELRAAAYETGYYATYLGDGATVPWEHVDPPFGMAILAFKIYLDTRFPETFRLHDWLYTPYGQLISCTQQEADGVFLDEIVPFDSVSGLIVWTACTLFGGPNFGVSQTGYPIGAGQGAPAPPPAQYGGYNPMAQLKVVLLFEDVTGGGAGGGQLQRIAGWSESVYTDENFIGSVDDVLQNGNAFGPSLLQTRAALLNTNARLRAYRVSIVGQHGHSRVVDCNIPGAAAALTDQPGASALFSGQMLATGNVRRWKIGGIPDSFIVNGELQAGYDALPSVRRYASALANFGMLTRPSSPVKIDALTVIKLTGLATLAGPSPFMAGQTVNVKGGNIAGGAPFPGSIDMLVIASGGNTVTLGDANSLLPGDLIGPTLTLSSKVLDFINPNTVHAVKASWRKVGRPFDLFHGRRSKRRQAG